MSDPQDHYRRQLDRIAALSRDFGASGLDLAMRHEIALAAEIQSRLRSAHADGRSPLLGVTLPAQDISGDFFEIVERPDGLTAFAIGDVAGKGVEAARLMALCSNLYRQKAGEEASPGRLLQQMNQALCRAGLPDGSFVTMIAGLFDPASGCVLLANAGHEPALLGRREGRFQPYGATVPPLGIAEDLIARAVPEEFLSLAGGCLYLFTDGLTEAEGQGPAMGEQELRRLILDAAQLPLALRAEALLGRLVLPGTAPRDDLTLLLVEDRRRPLLSRRLVLDAKGLEANRHAVRTVCVAAGMSGDLQEELVLAVDEACQNILRHGYGGAGEVVLEILLDGGRVAVQLIDFAPHVDMMAQPQRDLDELRPGGLGLHFIRSVMDEVDWPPPPPGAGNLLRMSKLLP